MHQSLGPRNRGHGGVRLSSLIQVSLIAWFGSPLMRFRRTRYEQYPHSHQAEHFIRPLALHVIQWTYPYFQKSLPKGPLYTKSNNHNIILSTMGMFLVCGNKFVFHRPQHCSTRSLVKMPYSKKIFPKETPRVNCDVVLVSLMGMLKILDTPCCSNNALQW